MRCMLVPCSPQPRHQAAAPVSEQDIALRQRRSQPAWCNIIVMMIHPCKGQQKHADDRPSAQSQHLVRAAAMTLHREGLCAVWGKDSRGRLQRVCAVDWIQCLREL